MHLTQSLILIGHLYLSGMLFGVPPRMDTKKTDMCLKKMELYTLIVILILDSKVKHQCRGICI
jgi:hypothetical protein